MGLTFQKRWLEKEVKLISDQECLDYDQYEDDCPLCCVITKYFLTILLVCFFIVIPFVMIYIGFTYRYCEDIFSAWLITGTKWDIRLHDIFALNDV